MLFVIKVLSNTLTKNKTCLSISNVDCPIQMVSQIDKLI